jgi:hypothetical protein
MVYTDKLLTGTSFIEVTTGTLLLFPFALGSQKNLEMLRKSISYRYSFMLDYFACGIRELHALPTTSCNTEERNLKKYKKVLFKILMTIRCN